MRVESVCVSVCWCVCVRARARARALTQLGWLTYFTMTDTDDSHVNNQRDLSDPPAVKPAMKRLAEAC